MDAMSYLERIFQVLDEPVTVEDSENAEDMPNINGDVSFENVEFEYDKGFLSLRMSALRLRPENPLP
jgi:ATP-binding cassette subfamily B protein